MGTQYQFTVVKMKLIVLIALIGCALATPNPYPQEEYGPANGLRIPDYHPYEKQQYGPANGLRIPGQYYNKGYYNKQQYGPTNGVRIPDYHPYEKQQYGPANGLRIPGQYYQKGYSKGYYHPRCYGGRTYRRRRTCIRRRRRGCYGRRSYAKGCRVIYC